MSFVLGGVAMDLMVCVQSVFAKTYLPFYFIFPLFVFLGFGVAMVFGGVAMDFFARKNTRKKKKNERTRARAPPLRQKSVFLT